MNRRRFLTASSMAAVGQIICAPRADAFLNCGAIYVDEIPLGIERSFWFPLGRQDHDRIVYVFVAPWCPYCHELYSNVYADRIPFSIRAIPAEPLSFSDRIKIANVIMEKSEKSISEFFNQRHRPIKSDFDFIEINDIQHSTIWAIRSWRAVTQSKPRSGVPLFVSSYRFEGDAEDTFFCHAGNNYLTDPTVTKNIRPYNFWNFDEWQAVYEAILRREKLPKILGAWPKPGTLGRARSLPLLGAFPYECVNEKFGSYVDSTFEYAGNRWYSSAPSPEGGGDGDKGKLLFFSEKEFEIWPLK